MKFNWAYIDTSANNKSNKFGFTVFGNAIKMKLLLLCVLITITSETKAQFYTNVNSEICYELYQKSDQIGLYRVFLVIDQEMSFLADSTMLKQFSKLDIASKTNTIELWRRRGKRIEVERAPFISYPFKLKKYGIDYNLQKIDQTIDWENSPWKDSKQYWQFEDRPF